MRRFLILLWLILIPCLANAEGWHYSSAISCSDTTSKGSFLIAQGFETTAESCTSCAEDNSETWTKTGTTVNVDATSSPLKGSQEATIHWSGSAAHLKSPTFTAQSTLYIHFRMSEQYYGSRYILYILLSGTWKYAVYMDSSGNLLVQDTGTGQTGTVNIPSATMRHIWLKIVSGTSIGIAVTTDGTQPGSYTEDTTSIATANMDQLDFTNGGDSYDLHIDQVIASSTAIGNVCD